MTWTWLGVAVLAFMALLCVIGYHRGFIKEVVSTAFLILAIVMVWFINPYVNEFLRENTPIYETVRAGCENLVFTESGGAQGMGAAQQDSLIGSLVLPDFLKEGIEENNTAEMYKYLAVNTFSEYVSEYLAQIVVNGISFLVSFFLATVLIRMVTFALDLISKLPVINGANKIAGALLGMIKGLVFVWIAFLVFTVLCNTEIGKNSLALIRKDQILSFLYEKDIFVQIFMSIFYGK